MTATSTEAAPRAARRWFRGDLDGLRAVAILLVVAFHAQIPGFDGGFIGVDVFFVISGYLITRNMLDEVERTGGLSLAAFWARRIRRLVPALALMVVVTSLASLFILSAFEVERLVDEGLAAALYLSNLLFASQSQGYFGADVSESPFLHTWSLGVEEQFYLVWPVLLTLTVRAVHRRPSTLRPAVAGVFAVVLLASLAHSLELTATASTWAFYGLPSRAWEFAAAGLVATATLPAWCTTRKASNIGTTAGLVFIAVATTTISESTPYPGTAALLPVVGTLLIVAVGHRPAGHRVPGSTGNETAGLTRLLSASPAQRLGRVSYSWYLWHWPMVVLATAAFDVDTIPLRTVAVVASLPIASVTYRYYERPIRFRWPSIQTNRRTLALGASLTVVAALVSLGTALLAASGQESPIEEQLEARNVNFFPTCKSKPRTQAGFEYCTGGDQTSSEVVVLVGDSKAATWFNVLDGVMEEVSVSLSLGTTPGCPFMDVEIAYDGTQPVDATQCDERRAQELDLIDELDADYVIISQSNSYLGRVGGSDRTTPQQAEIWKTSFEQMIHDLRADGRTPIVVLDNPSLPQDPTSCIARQGGVVDCELPTDEAMATIAPLRAAEIEVVRRVDVAHIDAAGQLCDERCRLAYDDYLVYVDKSHLSFRATERFRDELTSLFRSLRAASE